MYINFLRFFPRVGGVRGFTFGSFGGNGKTKMEEDHGNKHRSNPCLVEQENKILFMEFFFLSFFLFMWFDSIMWTTRKIEGG